MPCPARPGLLACALLLACLASVKAQGLSPPWWVTWDFFQAALRSDRCLNVSELAPLPRKTEFRFNITVCADAPEDKLVGLATFLTVRYDFGGQLFSSKVLDSRGKAVRPMMVKDGEQAMKLAGAALQGNHYFERTAVSSPLPCIDFYWVIFKPEIAQIWIDNLADLYGNINLLAADLFARVFRLEQFGVRATTLKFKDMASQPEGQPSAYV
ncbi:group-specific [Chlorella sorokiniana]|uniref:Group-specific n=1 Tax=Chlorella sorokiniana TaxID=3076 RepID=A0A2P6TI95_CHLSO|nr:group-specific [Chlorella sorokiniana]|eukprot:PRW34013.1 group-specific [Chlorella sorokiniana]